MSLTLRDLSIVGFSRGPTGDAELADWVSRVQGRGSDVTGSGVQTAVRNFIVGMKTDGLWTKSKRIGVYAGDARVALEAPLLNLRGATTDTLTGFVDANYTSNGLVGGSGKRINTGYNNTATGNDGNDISFAVYNRSASNTGSFEIGSGNTGDVNATVALEISNGGTTYGFLGNQTNYVNQADSNGTGLYVLSRVSSTDLRVFKNGSQLGSTVTTGAGAVSGFDVWVHDANLSNSSWGFSARQLAFYGIFTGLTTTDNANLYTRVQALQTALGRNV